MATLTITIPDAAVSRVQDAFGHATGDVVPGWEPATNAELR